MNNQKEKKRIVRLILVIITFTVLLVYFVNHTKAIRGFVGRIISLLFPFVLGCGIAFIINIPMKSIENKLFKREDSRLYRYKRGISMMLAYLAALSVIFIVCFIVIPEVKDTVLDIYYKLPQAAENVKTFLLEKTEKYPDIKERIYNVNIDWEKYEEKVTSFFASNGGNLVSVTVNIFSSIISAISNTFIALVFSLYILGSKEILARQLKMFIYAMFKEKSADEMMVLGRIANQTFSKFFASQFREGIILGTMFAVVMQIIRMPYALTIGVLIAFTALIPVFGAFIGLFIGCFLILVEAPKMVIWFIVLFFVLQFIENNFIYPRLVGGDVGLSPIWVLLAVLAGGDLMGIVGMFVFIPLVSVIYSYVRSIIYRSLKAKSIDIDAKVVADDVVPLMEQRRRMFRRRPRNNVAVSKAVNETEIKTESSKTDENDKPDDKDKE